MTNRLALVTFFFAFLPVLFAAPAAAQNEDWRGYPADEWPLAGGHFGQTRHSSLTQITPDNLDRLGGAWVTELGRGEVSRSTVVVRNGLLFLNTGQSIRALDAATGEERWRRDAPVGRMNKGVALGSGWCSRGSATRA